MCRVDGRKSAYDASSLVDSTGSYVFGLCRLRVGVTSSSSSAIFPFSSSVSSLADDSRDKTLGVLPPLSIECGRGSSMDGLAILLFFLRKRRLAVLSMVAEISSSNAVLGKISSCLRKVKRSSSSCCPSTSRCLCTCLCLSGHAVHDLGGAQIPSWPESYISPLVSCTLSSKELEFSGVSYCLDN